MRAALAVVGFVACAQAPSSAELERLRAEAAAANAAAMAAHADEAAAEPGRTLTIAGQLGGPGATLDWRALEAAATAHVATVNPQNPTDRARVIDFRGVLVRDLLDRFAAAPDVREVTFVALDGFRSTVEQASLRLFRAACPADVAIIAAGHLWTVADGQAALDRGADLIALGRAAIANPDWPREARGDGWEPRRPPLTIDELVARAASRDFAGYLRQFTGFVAD